MHVQKVILWLLALVLCTTACGGDSTEDKNAVPDPITLRQAGVEAHLDSGVLKSAGSGADDLTSTVREALRRIVPTLHSPAADIYIARNPDGMIQGTGAGGRTDPGSGDILVSLDPGFDRFDETLELWLPRTLAHELHHSKRILDGPGYGRTLGEAVFTEGAAVAFAEELFSGPTSPWATALKGRVLDRFERKVLRRWRMPDPQRVHQRWFFGTGNIPRWAGYAVGFELARRYASLTGATAAELTLVSPRRAYRVLSYPR